MCAFNHTFKNTNKRRPAVNRRGRNSAPAGEDICPSEKSLCPQRAAGPSAADSDLWPTLVALKAWRWQIWDRPSHSFPPSLWCAPVFFIRSAAVWSSGARSGAGRWRLTGRGAESGGLSLWRRSRRGATEGSQEPRPESCWSGSTCSPASSRHRCL